MPKVNLDKVQIRNPRTGRWTLVDARTGRIIRTAVARWVDVPVREYEGPLKRETNA